MMVQTSQKNVCVCVKTENYHNLLLFQLIINNDYDNDNDDGNDNGNNNNYTPSTIEI